MVRVEEVGAVLQDHHRRAPRQAPQEALLGHHLEAAGLGAVVAQAVRETQAQLGKRSLVYVRFVICLQPSQLFVECKTLIRRRKILWRWITNCIQSRRPFTCRNCTICITWCWPINLPRPLAVWGLRIQLQSSLQLPQQHKQSKRESTGDLSLRTVQRLWL